MGNSFNGFICPCFLFAIVSLPFQGLCINPAYHSDLPWLTGPIFTPSGDVIGLGHADLEPIVYCTTRTARYDNNWHAKKIPKFYQQIAQLTAKIGILEKVAFSCIVQSFRNETRGVSTSGFGDLPVGFDIQLIKEKKYGFPVKLIIQETLPVGKYNRLRAANKGTDAIGLGSYSTQIGIATCYLTHFTEENYLSTSAYFFIVANLPVNVRGLNTYGGDSSTHGRVRPGTSFNFWCAAEYTLTKNWVMAMDILTQFNLKGSFKGHTERPIHLPSTAQISIAPAIEYNWNKSIGVIVGPWFTVGGKNSFRFCSAVAGINYYY